jgi:hypothetical protein
MDVYLGCPKQRGSTVNELIIDEDEERFFSSTIPDEVLEVVASSSRGERTGIFTQWVCTAIYFCPGP